MRRSDLALRLAAFLLAFGFVFGQQSWAQGPRQKVQSASVSAKATRRPAGYEQRATVNRLLGLENKVLARNSNAIAQRGSYQAKLDQLWASYANNPSRRTMDQIRGLSQQRNYVTGLLSRSSVVMATRLPGIDGAISDALDQLRKVAAANSGNAGLLAFINDRATRQQSTLERLAEIAQQLPASP